MSFRHAQAVSSAGWVVDASHSLTSCRDFLCRPSSPETQPATANIISTSRRTATLHIGNQECVGGVRIKHPKYVVTGVVIAGIALGLVLIVTGISFVLGCLILLGFSALVWGPVLAALVLVVIPALWRDRFGPPR
jgi:hypothetical protein